MPSVYLSPSLQEFNLDVNGVSEETMMNYITDAMEPYLRLNGIDFRRNNPSMSLSEAIADSNRGNFDLHFGIHSNAAPPSAPGSVQGSWAYYYPYSAQSQAYAEIFAKNMARLYPDPSKVRTIPVTNLAELSQTTAPAVLYETAFHDNPEDSAFINRNVQNIAENYSYSIAEIFGKRLIPVCISGTIPSTSYPYNGLVYGKICTEYGPLNLRRSPNGEILASLPKDTQVVVLGRASNGWTPVRYNAITGYVASRYLCICATPPFPFSARLGRVSTQGGSLNLRRNASLTSPVLAAMPNGSLLVILEDNDDFYRVNYNGIVGYAARQFVDEVGI